MELLDERICSLCEKKTALCYCDTCERLFCTECCMERLPEKCMGQTYVVESLKITFKLLKYAQKLAKEEKESKLYVDILVKELINIIQERKVKQIAAFNKQLSYLIEEQVRNECQRTQQSITQVQQRSICHLHDLKMINDRMSKRVEVDSDKVVDTEFCKMLELTHTSDSSSGQNNSKKLFMQIQKALDSLKPQKYS